VGGIIISNSEFDIKILLFASTSAMLITGGGNIINDLFDIELDKIVHPNRPLPAGKINIDESKIIYVVVNLLAFILLIQTSFSLVIIGLLVIIILYFYSSSLKKIFIIANLVVAALTGLTFIFAGLAVGNIEGSFVPSILAFMLNLIREIIKDSEDLEGDIKYNIKSIPAVLGIERTRKFLFALILILLLLTVYPFLSGLYKIEYFITIMIFFNPILIFSGKIFIESKTKENLKTASLLLKINMLIGLLAIFLGK
jgi:geranylgeranylglycerol-phosphate geranylgeranyltransferase